MDNIAFEYLYKYGLHDCKMDSICFDAGNIVFSFPFGIYELNAAGKEISLTEKCNVVIKIENFSPKKAWQYIESHKLTRGTIFEIDIDTFIDALFQANFDIDMHYYSGFCNTILLKGNILENEYEIKISDVTGISYQFN